jgi:hypothetical protein
MTMNRKYCSVNGQLSTNLWKHPLPVFKHCRVERQLHPLFLFNVGGFIVNLALIHKVRATAHERACLGVGLCSSCGFNSYKMQAAHVFLFMGHPLLEQLLCERRNVRLFIWVTKLIVPNPMRAGGEFVEKGGQRS